MITLHYCKVGQSTHPLKHFLTPLRHCLLRAGRTLHCGILSWKRRQQNESHIDIWTDEHIPQMLDTRGTERLSNSVWWRQHDIKVRGHVVHASLVWLCSRCKHTAPGLKQNWAETTSSRGSRLGCCVFRVQWLRSHVCKRTSNRHLQSIQVWKHPKCKLSYFCVYKQKSKGPFHTGVAYIILKYDVWLNQ